MRYERGRHERTAGSARGSGQLCAGDATCRSGFSPTTCHPAWLQADRGGGDSGGLASFRNRRIESIRHKWLSWMGGVLFGNGLPLYSHNQYVAGINLPKFGRFEAGETSLPYKRGHTHTTTR